MGMLAMVILVFLALCITAVWNWPAYIIFRNCGKGPKTKAMAKEYFDLAILSTSFAVVLFCWISLVVTSIVDKEIPHTNHIHNVVIKDNVATVEGKKVNLNKELNRDFQDGDKVKLVEYHSGWRHGMYFENWTDWEEVE